MFIEAKVILDNAECQCIGLSGLCGSYTGRHRGLRPRQRICQPFGLKALKPKNLEHHKYSLLPA